MRQNREKLKTEKPANRTYADGIYTVSVVCEPDADADFAAYNLTMKVRIENDRITDISGISGDGGSDNDSYIKKAAQGTSKYVGVVTQITEKGMPEGIDTVARATCSSNAIIEAARKHWMKQKNWQRKVNRDEDILGSNGESGAHHCIVNWL